MNKPWHFLPMALFTLGWTVGAAADFVMTHTLFGPYVDLFTDAQVAYFTTLPIAFDGPWAIGAICGVLGALLMLFRGPGAPLMLSVAALAMVYCAVWLMFVSDPPMRSVAGWIGDAIVTAGAAISVIVWLYARAQRMRGVLS
ncbi:MAG: hypothetical protein AAFQ79_07170 [Pseudomonadota bacterium]